jgi:NADH-quinone oxidoreductase subunit F
MIIPTEPIDLSLLDPVLARYNGRSRDALLPLLHEAQALYGWLPPTVQDAISRTLRVPLADIHGVIEFYTMFYNEPTAKRVIRVCEDMACSLAGGEAVKQAIEAELGLRHGQTSPDGLVTYERVPCLGMCEQAPSGLVGKRPFGNLTPADIPAFLNGKLDPSSLKIYGEPLLKLFRAGRVDPTSLDSYLAHAGYKDLRKAIAMTPDEIINMLKASDVLGRGGAMFPVGLKWGFTRQAAGSPAHKHIIANADESEPGTFKDRVLMEHDPFSLIEAMTIAAYAVGAENGWIFVRGEYPLCAGRLENAIRQARAAGYLGQNLLGRKGFHFDIELRLGAGAYICGEETALFEAIEGKRGFPRIKPPFPTTHGLFGQPTAVNNIETLVATMAVIRLGLDEWNKLGTAESPGTKWFCLSGHIAKPGLYEVPFGLTVRELIERAGGVPAGKAIQAVLLGGAAGVFIGQKRLDVPLTYEDAKANQFPIGSGVVLVFDETADLRQPLYQLARFFAHESCGKCFPCQLGTQRQMEILGRIAGQLDQHSDQHSGNGQQPIVYASDKNDLHDIGFAMTETSLCGLGQTAASAVLSALELWPELVE